MKRITWDKPNGEWGVEGASISNAPLPIYNALERLRDYERLGLDPDELEQIDKMYAEKCRELAEYKRLEEQGLLLRLPCKVGDKVYKFNPITLNEIVEINIESIFITLGRVSISGRTTIMKYAFCCSPSDFGKTVFLTKEEAEQALAEMKGV